MKYLFSKYSQNKIFFLSAQCLSCCLANGSPNQGLGKAYQTWYGSRCAAQLFLFGRGSLKSSFQELQKFCEKPSQLENYFEDLELYFSSQLNKLKAENDYLKNELESIETQCRNLDESVSKIQQNVEDKTIDCKRLFEDCKFIKI